MSPSNSTLEPAEAVPRRVERDTYSVADVRKALCFLLAHVEKGDAPPTPWTVAHKLLKMPAMYDPVRACLLSPSVCGLAAATPIRVLPCATPAVARARFSCVWTRPNPCAEALVALGHACAQLKNAWAAIEKMPADARRPRSPRTSCRERVARRAVSRSSATTRRRFLSPSATWLR